MTETTSSASLEELCAQAEQCRACPLWEGRTNLVFGVGNPNARVLIVGEAPGKTTHINYFRIDNAMYLVDLPGYGYAKVPKSEKERWAKLIESYFAAPDLITFGVLIVDARHKPTANDVIMAQYFQNSGKPYLVVANKLDKLKKSEIVPNLERIRQTLELEENTVLIPFSAEKGEGREELLSQILRAADV